HAPYGYRFTGQGWIEDEHEQRAISLMRQLRADGLSLRRIAAELDQRGHHNRRGRRLSAQTIANVLKRG
ncbi:MAG: recombinase family protein, partial [Phycisphaerales bacterium]